MTRIHLAMCPACSRHVRVDEATCPFCATALPATFGGTPAAVSPAVRLSRAALYAVGVGALSLSAAQACGGEVSGSGHDGGTSSGLDAAGQMDVSNCCPPYGTVPPFDAGNFPDAAADAAPHIDASGDAGGDATEEGAVDAAVDAARDVGIAPPYGMPPPEPFPDPEED